MKNKLLLLLAAILFSCSTASAQAWLWGAQGKCGLKTAISGQNIATDKTGNVYQTGSYETEITFGKDTLISHFEDVFLVKYDQDGNLLWAITSQSQSAPGALSVATDDSDNAYITGYDNGIIFGTDTVNGSSGGFIAKYAPDGNVMWAKPCGSGSGVATDNFRHEYVTGIGFLTKYDRNGNIIWNDAQNGGTKITTDISGNVYISGAFTDTLKLGTDKLYSANPALFVAKLDSNDHVLWAKQSTNTPTPYNGVYSAITVNKSGSVYLAGTFTSAITFSPYKFTAPSGSNYDFFLVKYDPDGAIAWGRQAIIPSAPTTCFSYSVCADDSNYVYIGGTGSSPFVYANDTINTNGASFLLKLDSSGHVICGSVLDGDAYNGAGVAADSTGKFVYFANELDGISVAGKDTLIDNSGADDPMVARWKQCSACNFSVTSSPPPPICYGQSVTLTVDGAKNYSWSPAAGLSAVTGDTVVAAPSTNTTYTIISSASDCADTAQITITVNPLPDFSLSPTTPSICNGQYVILSANGDSSDISYIWSPATGLGYTAGSSVVAIPSITTTYTVVATLNSCSDSEQIVVHVGAPIVTIFPPNPSVCPGQSILLVAGGATTYVWSPTQSLNSSTGDTVVATPSIQTTYTVIGTIAGGCSASDTDVVAVNLGLNTPTITQRGDTLFSSATQGNQWVRNDTLIPGATNVFYVITESGWYKVLAINPANGCSTASDSTYLVPTGISQLAINSEQLSVYPNPTGGAIFVNISSSVAEIKDWSLQITDVLGRTVYARQVLNYSNDIDLSNLSSGVYFITIINKTGRGIVPVVKQN